MKFSALAGNGMQRVSSDAAAVLFFLKKRKKRMGAQIGRTEPSAPTAFEKFSRFCVGAMPTSTQWQLRIRIGFS